MVATHCYRRGTGNQTAWAVFHVFFEFEFVTLELVCSSITFSVSTPPFWTTTPILHHLSITTFTHPASFRADISPAISPAGWLVPFPHVVSLQPSHELFGSARQQTMWVVSLVGQDTTKNSGKVVGVTLSHNLPGCFSPLGQQ
ncbi:hypothetical protein VTI74DRAFT_6637 [Chaetomium olivicolor]